MNSDKRELVKLFTMGSRWYAGIRDGNITIGGLFGAPTAFPATMTRDEVLAEMRRRTPDLQINESVLKEGGN